MVIVISGLATNRTISDEIKAGSPAPSVNITVTEIQFANQSGLEAINGLLILKLSVENASDRAMQLDIKQFQLICDGKTIACHSGVRSPLVATPKTINAGDSVDGYLGMNISYPSGDEPPLELTWNLNNQRIVLSINKAIRKVTNLKTRLIGPNNSLAVIDLDRGVDKFSVWLLAEEFKRLQLAGIRRVVLNAKPDASQQPSYRTRVSVSGWLASVKEGKVPARFGLGNLVNSQTQFAEFFVAGMGTRDPSGFSTATRNFYHGSVELAISSALKSVYETIPLELAMPDLNSDEPGILRAAVESNIDRMTEVQLQELLSDAASRPPSYQALLAANLYRVAVPAMVSSLAKFVRSDNKEISQAALVSLVKSVSPQAVTALKEIWYESDDFALRNDIAVAIIASRDHRHADLLEQHASALIAAASQPQPEQQTPPPKKQTINPNELNAQLKQQLSSQSSVAFAAMQTPRSRTLKSVLEFLNELESNEVVEVANQKLLNIEDPAVQDVVLQFLLKTNPIGDLSRIARGYISNRLRRHDKPGELTPEQKAALSQLYGPPGTTRNLRITSTLMSTIRRFPNSSYTERLLELADDQAISSTMRRSSFQVAARCATDEQLNKLIEDFEVLDRYGKEFLLKTLSELNHPRWLSLATECMALDKSTQGLAIGSLVSNGSAEAMMVLVDRLTELVQQAIDDADSTKQSNSESTQISSPLLRPIPKLMTGLRECKLPEARRILNRCERSPLIKLNELAVNNARDALRTSPNFTSLSAASRLRLNKQYKEALVAYNDILAADPFCALAYSARSSMHSRLGNQQAAIDDLQQALQLEPEDVLIESLVALAEVEAGRSKKGIQMMEATLKSIPDLPTFARRDALYNLGCAYGRALDDEKDKNLQQQYMNRGMEVLRDCVERKNGWNDPKHVENDPDVDAFRTHPDWAELMTKMKQNEKNN